MFKLALVLLKRVHLVLYKAEKIYQVLGLIWARFIADLT